MAALVLARLLMKVLGAVLVDAHARVDVSGPVRIGLPAMCVFLSASFSLQESGADDCRHVSIADRRHHKSNTVLCFEPHPFSIPSGLLLLH